MNRHSTSFQPLLQSSFILTSKIIINYKNALFWHVFMYLKKIIIQIPERKFFGSFLHLRPNYIHSASNDIHTDGARARG